MYVCMCIYIKIIVVVLLLCTQLGFIPFMTKLLLITVAF